jgi:feruloyl esterase
MIYMHTAAVVREIRVTRNADQRIPAATARLVNDAVMQACDVHGEGFLNNPRQCAVDFSALACSAGESGDQCLAPGQLQTIATYYGGLLNGVGELIFAGQALGNPLPALQGFDTSGNPGYGFDTLRYWGFQDENYDWREFDLDRDMPIVIEAVGYVNAVDPDLREFEANGGKLLLYAGWADTAITPENTVHYYTSVLEEMGPEQADWLRLFMVPGMGHCGGGAGPTDFDLLAALDTWVADDEAPEQLFGTNPQSGLTRPNCPYPEYAEYAGSGALQDAANWTCAAP